MALPYQRVDMGTFTSAATLARQDVVLPGGRPDKFVLRNRTAWGDDAAETSVESIWFRGMADNAAQTIDQAVTSGAMSTEAVTTGGFIFIDTANPPTYAELATTAITAAEPAVVSMASTGSIAVGDVVRLSDTTAMLQVSSMDFQVTAVTANVSITLQLDSSGFAAAATAGNVRLFVPNRFYPRWRYIVPLEDLAGVTQATQAIVNVSVAHDFTVGERVSFRIPDEFGMSQLDGLSGTVLSVGTVSEGTYTVQTTGEMTAFRVDIDTSGFSAFAFPTSAQFAAGLSNAIVLPAGSNPIPNANPPAMNINAAFDNRNRYVMRCGTNVVTSTSAVYEWEAYYSDTFTAD